LLRGNSGDRSEGVSASLRRSWYSPADSGKKDGDIRRMTLHEERIPGPIEGQIQVRVRAVGLNFADVFSVLGLYKATPRPGTPGYSDSLGFIPGLEFSGTVERIGPGENANDLKIGDKVMGVTRFPFS